MRWHALLVGLGLLAGLLLGGVMTIQAFSRHVLIDGIPHYYLGDDAMISMRYAYNLAHGRGFVWNPGEYVQGYTNLGWALGMAVVHWLRAPLHLAPLVVLLINVGVYLALLAILLRRLRPVPGLIAAALVALDGSLLEWTLHGFEATIQALLITLAVLPFLVAGPARLASIWAALAFVVRPDALVVFAWVALLMVRRREFRWTLTAGAGLVALRVIQPDGLVGVFAAGIVPYYMPYHRFHDMLGKSERRIARGPVKAGLPGHNKWDYDYTLEVVRPAYIITNGFNGTEDEYGKHVEGWKDYAFYPRLWFDERFRRDYQRVAASPDHVVWIYARRR